MPSPFREQACTRCGGAFTARGTQPFCSKACSKTVPIETRFWRKVQQGEACWEWSGSQSRDGYGRIRYGDRTEQATRISWMLHHGSLPDAEVCHRCDNPPCVRPDHLFLGTHRENMMDAVRKGRIGVGLDEAAAAAIRALGGSMPQVQIAERFQVGQTHISRILRGKAWAE